VGKTRENKQYFLHQAGKITEAESRHHEDGQFLNFTQEEGEGAGRPRSTEATVVSLQVRRWFATVTFFNLSGLLTQ